MQIAILIIASISAVGVIVTGYVALVLRVRRNEERIRNCDEDLHRWVESEAAELRREEIAIALKEKRSGARPYLMHFQKDQARRHVLRRYEEQQLSAERLCATPSSPSSGCTVCGVDSTDRCPHSRPRSRRPTSSHGGRRRSPARR